MGLIISTLSIVCLGEITPQALCSRHGLYIGAKTIWIMKTFIVLLFIIAWPISLVLDRILGVDIGSFHTSEELKHLVRVHVEKPQGQEESGLNPEDAAMLTGVLEYKHMTVKDVMTDLDKVYMIELNTKMTFSVLMEIYKSGFTRIPVYEGTRSNIVGILFTKDEIVDETDTLIDVNEPSSIVEKRVLFRGADP